MNFLVDGGVVAVVIGLVSTAKVSGLPSNWAPLLSLVLGVVVDVAFKSVLLGSVTFGFAFLTGIVTGLTASGLYSGVKTTAALFKPNTAQ